MQNSKLQKLRNALIQPRTGQIIFMCLIVVSLLIFGYLSVSEGVKNDWGFNNLENRTGNPKVMPVERMPVIVTPIPQPTKDYPKLELRNETTNDLLVEMSLIKNTQECFIDCEAIINISLTQDMPLFTSLEFTTKANKKKFLDYNIYYQAEDRKDEPVYSYIDACEEYEPLERDGMDCTVIKNYEGTKEVITYDWRKYQGEVMPAGDYLFKLEAKKKPSQIIDWSFNLMDVPEEEIRQYWAWWNSSWTKKRQIVINTTDAVSRGNISVLINISYDSDMQTDFDDLRFSDEEEDDELYYWFDNNSYVTGEWVNVWVYMNRNISSASPTNIYVYYDNAGVNTTSNISNAFMIGEDFTGGLAYSTKWFTATPASHPIDSAGYINLTGFNGDANYLGIRSEYGNITGGHVMVSRNRQTTNGNGLYTNSIQTLRQDWDIDETPSGFGGAMVTNGQASAFLNGYQAGVNGDYVANQWIRISNSLQSNGTGLINMTTDDGTAIRTHAGTVTKAPVGRVAFNTYASGIINQIDWIYVNRFTLVPPSYTIGAETIESADVDLLYPADAFKSNNASVNTTCNASNVDGVLNITLLLDGVANYTVSNTTAGENLTLSIIQNYSEASYTWNCLATMPDLETYTDALNRTFSVDFTAPQINITAPVSVNNIIYQGDNFTLNWSISDPNLQTCWYSYNGSNQTINCSANTTGVPVQEHAYNITVWANDSTGNTNSKSYQWYYKLFIKNEVYESVTYQTTTENFKVNMSSNGSQSITSNFVYDSASFTAQKTGSDTSAQFNKSYVHTETGVKQLYWSFNVGGEIINTTARSQTVLSFEPVTILTTICPANTTTSMFFNFSDEQNRTALQTFEVSYNFKYGVTNNTGITVSNNLSGIDNFSICVNNSFIDNASIGYGEVDYKKTGYSQRRFYLFEDILLTNVTANYTLYSLLNGDSTSFLVTVQDPDLSPYQGKYTTLLRWYPELDSYKIVEMGKTDDKGQTVKKVQVEDVDYRLGVYHTNGTLIYLANPIRMVCIASPCTYLLNVQSTASLDYNNYLNVESGLTESNGIFTLVYNDVSQSTQEVQLNVYKLTGAEETLICQDTSTSFSDILTCDVSAYTGSIKAIALRTASPQRPIDILLRTFGASLFNSNIGLFVSIIIFIVLVMLGTISPPIAIVLAIISFIPALMLKVITLQIFIGLGIIAVITIHFIRRAT